MSEIKRAVIFVDDESGGEENIKKPLILQDILFCPVLTWLSTALCEQGIERFFLFCTEQYKEEALSKFVQPERVIASNDRDALEEFLQGDEKIMIIPGAAIPIDTANKNYVYAASGANILKSMVEDSDEVENAETVEGFTSVRSFRELNTLQFLARGKILRNLVAADVNVMDPNNTYIDPRVRIGAGTLVLPGTILRGNTVIGKNCEIGPNAMVNGCIVGDETVINASQINESTVGSRTHVGPYAYIRPGCTIGDDIKVGDFVEVKNSVVGNGTKISHLTYVGDSDVGEHVNFGCGTVTVNYDGKKKYRCTIGDHAFLGCNTNLVAPVQVGNGAFTAAGSTITEDVPEGDLGIARQKQMNLPGWADQRRKDGRLK